MTGAVLSPGEAVLILFGLFFLLMFLRVPVAFALGLACLPILIIEPRLDTMTLMQETFNAYNSFILLAVPFFLPTGNLMNVGGTTDRLMQLSRTIVGHFPGSPAQINVVLSIFFAGISRLLDGRCRQPIEDLHRGANQRGLRSVLFVRHYGVSAVLAVIIPPSILMIVWGGLLTVSIGALFLAGIVPGLLIGLAQMATVHAYAKVRGYPTYPRSSWRELLCACWIAIPA
jgi:tripartite ATP-independent transporter DctM subunit